MNLAKPYKAILFDSGHVLNEPASSHWFFPPDFYRYVDKIRFAALSMDRVLPALRKATRYLEEQTVIRSEMEEYRHFLMFYRILAAEWTELKLGNREVEGLARDIVLHSDKFRFYPDVFTRLPQFAAGHKLAVVSDAYPSLERVYREKGVRKHFTSFVLSSVVGAVKPQPLIYEKALNELGVSPGEALFVDDRGANLDGARALGIATVRMQRPGQLPEAEHSKHPVIHSLDELARLLQEDGAKAPSAPVCGMLSFA